MGTIFCHFHSSCNRAYILGYFILMDTHQPTNPLDKDAKLESFFRRAPFEPTATKGGVANTFSPFPHVTIWNSIYQPMDRLYFHAYPRSDQEIEHLRSNQVPLVDGQGQVS